jgi:Transposase
LGGSNIKRKTDKDDALKLARMAAMQELKAVHMPSEEHREFCSLVKYRKTLDYRINKMKCAIRAWFVNHGITIDSGEKAWNTGRVRIDSFRKPLSECNIPSRTGPNHDLSTPISKAQINAMTAVKRNRNRSDIGYFVDRMAAITQSPRLILM